MGNKQMKQRNSNLSTVSYGRSISTAPTNESRMLRFTTDSSLSSSMIGGIDTYFNRFPNGVVDGICSFLTINDITNLYCTSRFVYERFYTSLPYSIKCGNLLYKLYEDKRGIARKAVQTKHASWPQVLQSFIQNRKEMKNLKSSLSNSLQQAYQQHIIYPPLLMDEITKEGLNSEFQRQIMQKMSDTQEYQSITQIQMLNQTKAYFKKSTKSKEKMITMMLQIRTLRQFNTSEKQPELFNIIIITLESIKSILQIIALTLECSAASEDNIGLLDFYLYNLQMYLIWMQQIDEHVSQYLNLFDIILKEFIPNYNFPPFTIQWIMMNMWNHHIYSKCRHHLRIIFLQQIKAVRINPNLKYEQYLLRDFVKSLIDLSTNQKNIRMAGHSKFVYTRDLEHLFPLIIQQTQDLQEMKNFNFIQDIEVLRYVFQKHILENNLIPYLLQDQYKNIQQQIREIKQSADYNRRIIRYNEENQFINQQPDYTFSLLNINKVSHKIRSIINGEPFIEPHLRLTINYQKNTYDKVSYYLQDYHKEFYEQIQKLGDLDVVASENVQLRDAMIIFRNKQEIYEEYLSIYEELPEVETLKQMIKVNQLKNSKKSSISQKKHNQPKLLQQNDLHTFIPITIVAGFNLAQSLTEQFISQQ